MLGIIIMGVLLYVTHEKYINMHPQKLIIDSPELYKYIPNVFLQNFKIHSINLWGNVAVFILFLGYPAYLIARFILWAIRTLEKRK